MRVGKIVPILLFCGLIALLMSALVVAPEAAAPPPQPVSWADARLLPLTLPVQGTEAQPAQPSPLSRAAGLVVLLLSPALPLLAARRDANGRVLQAKRYENSFYQVFRQEVAGG